VAAAEAAGKEDVQKALRSAEEQAQSLYRGAEEQGREAALKAAGETREKCDALAKEAGARMGRAAAIIVERVVNAQ
jgi:vacuolar-type H+-ATPase subunit H